MKTVHRFGLV